MHILYLHQYFTTRTDVGGTRSYEFARYFVNQGHRVTLVTSGGQSGTQTRSRSTYENIDGIDVLRVGAGYADYQRATALAYSTRIRRFVQFALAGSLNVLRIPAPDVVFATSTPLTIGIPGMLASLFHRVPLVFEVRDLWPEAPIQMGALRNPVAIALARLLERTIYRQSAHVVALSPGMRDGIVAAGIPPERVVVIPNASDLDLFSPDIDGSAVRTRLSLTGKFVCTYFGSMGAANDLMQVVGAARILHDQQQDDIAFVLHGDGGQRPALEAFCRQHGLTNVVFSDPIPDKQAIARLAAASDVCMTIYKNVPVLATCSPNKLFDTFAAGRPAIVNSAGWLKELVEQHEAGVYARPDDAAHLAERVTFLRDHPDLVKVYGQNARRLAEQQFNRRKLAAHLLTILQQAAAPARGVLEQRHL